MANTRIDEFIRNLRQQSYGIALDQGGPGNPGYIEIMDGVQRAGPWDPITTQRVLGRLYLSYPSTLPPQANGRVTWAPVSDDVAPNNTGIATWARMYDGDGNARVDCDVGTAGTAIILTTTSITQNPGLISLVSLYVIVPNGG